MTAFVVVIIAGLGSYAFRASMLVLAARGGLPPMFERAARFAVPTAFAALATGALVVRATGGAAVPPIVAVAVAAAAVRRTGSPHAALLAGMPVLWLVSAAVPA